MIDAENMYKTYNKSLKIYNNCYNIISKIKNILCQILMFNVEKVYKITVLEAHKKYKKQYPEHIMVNSKFGIIGVYFPKLRYVNKYGIDEEVYMSFIKNKTTIASFNEELINYETDPEELETDVDDGDDDCKELHVPKITRKVSINKDIQNMDVYIFGIDYNKYVFCFKNKTDLSKFKILYL